MTIFTNGACAVRESIPVRMLQMNPQEANAFDVNVTYAQPHSRKSYANDVKRERFDGCPTSILNIGCAIFLVVYLYA